MQPAFRLNAPQTDDAGDAEESNPFGSIGNHVEFPSTAGARNNDNSSLGNTSQQQHANSLVLWLKQQQQETVDQQPPTSPSVQMASATQQTLTENKNGEQPLTSAPRRAQKWLIALGVLGMVILVGLVVAIMLSMAGNNGSSGGDGTSSNASSQGGDGGSTGGPPGPWTPSPTPQPPSAEPASSNSDATPPPDTTLGRIYNAGVLKCGIPIEQVGFATLNLEAENEIDYLGFDADLCKAVAAGIFGDAEPGRLEFVPVALYDRFAQLQDGTYDVLACTTTRTMEREVFESTTGVGFTFSTPYLYNGLQFSGAYPYVECADNLTVSEPQCEGTKICAYDSSTHVQVIVDSIPNVTVVSVVQSGSLHSNFVQGFCNVIAGEQFDLAESFVRDLGYTGDYMYGSLFHSKEPLSMVTRGDDAQFSDFVNWVVEALISADEARITQDRGSAMPPTSVFGEAFQGMFRNVISAVGNYGEMYARNLEALVPRPVADSVNTGDSGVIYSLPFGTVDAVGNGPVEGGTLEAILKRGFLNCGISTRVIFASFDEATKEWSGLYVDFCKALSAAIFGGVNQTIRYFDLDATERFLMLEAGEVDVLSRLTTVTLSRDVLEPSIRVGLSFAQPNFYDGMTFGGIPPYAQCADDLVIVGTSCEGLKICVNSGTTFEEILKELFPSRVVVSRDGDAFQGLVDGECNAIAGGVVDVSSTSVRASGYDGPYQIGSNRYSKEPLAMVTRQDDPQWSKFVYWVVGAIFYADEEEITMDFAELMPKVQLFGEQFQDMFVNAIRAVGKYGEIYERHAQDDLPRGGLNMLNEYLGNPQFYPIPGMF